MPSAKAPVSRVREPLRVYAPLASENVTPVWKSQIKQEYNTGGVSPRGGSLSRTSLVWAILAFVVAGGSAAANFAFVWWAR